MERYSIITLVRHYWQKEDPIMSTGHWHYLTSTLLLPQGLSLVQSKHLNINTFRPRQNARHFTEFCSYRSDKDITSLVQIMAWRRPGHKPLSEPVMVSLPTHISVTRPQWVNSLGLCYGLPFVIEAVIIATGNGLWSVRRQAIIGRYDALLETGPFLSIVWKKGHVAWASVC